MQCGNEICTVNCHKHDSDERIKTQRNVEILYILRIETDFNTHWNIAHYYTLFFKEWKSIFSNFLHNILNTVVYYITKFTLNLLSTESR